MKYDYVNGVIYKKSKTKVFVLIIVALFSFLFGQQCKLWYYDYIAANEKPVIELPMLQIEPLQDH